MSLQNLISGKRTAGPLGQRLEGLNHTGFPIDQCSIAVERECREIFKVHLSSPACWVALCASTFGGARRLCSLSLSRTRPFVTCVSAGFVVLVSAQFAFPSHRKRGPAWPKARRPRTCHESQEFAQIATLAPPREPCGPAERPGLRDQQDAAALQGSPGLIVCAPLGALTSLDAGPMFPCMRSSISDRLIALAASACLAAGLVMVPADSQAQLREGPEPELELPDLSPPEMEGEVDEAL